MNENNKWTAEQRILLIRESNRLLLNCLFFIFLILWFAFIAFLVINVDMGVYEGLGLGTVTGVLMKCLSDSWQFYHRKAPK